MKNAILLLMINAAVLGTTTVSLSSAWAYGEVRGWPHSLQKPIKEAPAFYAVYVLAGLMLPSAIVFLQLLLNAPTRVGITSSIGRS
jgi:hypothetical protein